MEKERQKMSLKKKVTVCFQFRLETHSCYKEKRDERKKSESKSRKYKKNNPKNNKIRKKGVR